MQNSKLFRRGVVVPIDQSAEDNLRLNDVCHTTKVRFLEISGDVFYSLWKVGLFNEVNERCSAAIDDYEEEWLDPRLAGEILAAIASVGRSAVTQEREIATFLRELQELVRYATSLQRPMLFVL